MKKYSRLVWVRGLKGPEPQIWNEETDKDGAGRKSGKVIVEYEISEDERAAGLKLLAASYPPPPDSL